MLDTIIKERKELGREQKWKDRCIVMSPRHDFIRPWIRAYFSYGNTIPLVIVPGPPGDWQEGDMEYCQKAVEFCGGIVFDCSDVWENSKRLAERAVRKNRPGWFTKKGILYAVAHQLSPKSWAWIDDDAEVTGNLDECFDCAECSHGFILTQFYYPNSIDNCHPERYYRSNIDTDDKICWNSMVFFHGDANKRITEELNKDFPVEDDEIVFCHLYKTNPVWYDGFCDFSIREWQMNCKKMEQIPKHWEGKLLHYTSTRNGWEMKKMWAAKAETLRKAPFERDESTSYSDEHNVSGSNSVDDGSIDAVFVIGTGSVNNNEELRYALRNLEKHCSFIRNVYICGYCPPWVNKSIVKHLQWPDRFTHAKDANIIDKLRHACEQPGISKRILFCSDDQFQTHPCTWDDFTPRYLRRYASSDKWYENRHRVWHTRLRNTLEREVQRRKMSGMDANEVFYYQPHIWMPIDRDTFIDYARWSVYERREDTIIASGYFNFANVVGKPDFDHEFLHGDAKDIPKTTHIAYHDGSYPEAMRILKQLFKSPSKFEVVDKQSSIPVLPQITTKNDSHVNRSIQMDTDIEDEDPSPAREDERSAIIKMAACARDNLVWGPLLGEISRAEELRLFGVKGWRTVWRDIILRWSKATDDGKNLVRVDAKRSEAASRIITNYMSNPDSMRTIRFTKFESPKQNRVLSNGVKTYQPASHEARTELRDKIKLGLHR